MHMLSTVFVCLQCLLRSISFRFEFSKAGQFSCRGFQYSAPHDASACGASPGISHGGPRHVLLCFELGPWAFWSEGVGPPRFFPPPPMPPLVKSLRLNYFSPPFSLAGVHWGRPDHRNSPLFPLLDHFHEVTAVIHTQVIFIHCT